MPRILFDQNIPIGLRRVLPAQRVTLASEAGWAQISHGDLISAAEQAGFDVLMTADRNLQYQQTITGRRIAIVVLGTNHWKTLRDQSDRIVAILDRIEAGSFREVAFDHPRQRVRP